MQCSSLSLESMCKLLISSRLFSSPFHQNRILRQLSRMHKGNRDAAPNKKKPFPGVSIGSNNGSNSTYVCVCVCACTCTCSVMADSLQPHGLQPSRLLCPWNFLGKNTGVWCHILHPYIMILLFICNIVRFSCYSLYSIWGSSFILVHFFKFLYSKFSL